MISSRPETFGIKPVGAFVLLLFLFFFIETQAQVDSTYKSLEIPTEETKPFNKKWIVAPAILVNTAGMVYLEYKWWWEGNYHPFQYNYEGFFNNYSLGVDKIGHFYISYLYFHSLYNGMKWADYSDKSSLILSAAIPTIYALSVEIGDGYSSYNFSADDLASNLVGIGYGVLQVKKPFFKNFNVKWSYYPSSWSMYNNKKNSITDDYGGHVYWLSCDVHNLLPQKAQKYWPSFLNLAVGYGMTNKAGTNLPEARKFTFGIDYNISSLPLKGTSWNMVKNFLDLFHFPAPGIRKVQGKPVEFKPLILN